MTFNNIVGNIGKISTPDLSAFYRNMVSKKGAEEMLKDLRNLSEELFGHVLDILK